MFECPPQLPKGARAGLLPVIKSLPRKIGLSAVASRFIGSEGGNFDSAKMLGRSKEHSGILVMLSEGSHPFPYRTRSLSPLEPMIVGFPAKVGSCQIYGEVS